jgi:hypothetical protein
MKKDTKQKAVDVVDKKVDVVDLRGGLADLEGENAKIIINEDGSGTYTQEYDDGP